MIELENLDPFLFLAFFNFLIMTERFFVFCFLKFFVFCFFFWWFDKISYSDWRVITWLSHSHNNWSLSRYFSYFFNTWWWIIIVIWWQSFFSFVFFNEKGQNSSSTKNKISGPLQCAGVAKFQCARCSVQLVHGCDSSPFQKERVEW